MGHMSGRRWGSAWRMLKVKGHMSSCNCSRKPRDESFSMWLCEGKSKRQLLACDLTADHEAVCMCCLGSPPSRKWNLCFLKNAECLRTRRANMGPSKAHPKEFYKSSGMLFLFAFTVANVAHQSQTSLSFLLEVESDWLSSKVNFVVDERLKIELFFRFLFVWQFSFVWQMFILLLKALHLKARLPIKGCIFDLFFQYSSLC